DLVASVAALGLRGIERDGWIEVEPLDPDVPIDSLLARAVLFKQTPQGFLGTGAFYVINENRNALRLRRVKSIPGRITDVEVLSFVTLRDAFARAIQGEINALIMPDAGQIELLQGIPRFRLIRGQGVQGIAAIFNTERLSAAERRALATALSADLINPLYDSNCEFNARPAPKDLLPPGTPLGLHVIESDAAVVRLGLGLRRALGARGGS